MRKIFTLIAIAIAVDGFAQETWSMEQCMMYAADHASSVVQARWDVASATASRNAALADFFPSISAQVGTQFNWGRNIDPETNTYNDVTTFNNGYGLYASLTLFDGGQTLNRYKRARNERTRYANAVEMQRDDKAIAAMMAYADAVYYQKSIKIAQDKLTQSQNMLRFIERQEELGIKSRPDVAEAKATVANDEYELVHQQNLYSQAMLTLKATMNFPSTQILEVDTAAIGIDPLAGQDNIEGIYDFAIKDNPKSKNAAMMVKSSEYYYKIAKGGLMPTISIDAGISTSYYKNMVGGYIAPGFGDQFRNNRGEYVSATLSIPLFNGLSRISEKQRSRYALEVAKEQQNELERQLHDDISAAVMDRDGYAKEVNSMQAKVEADAEAYRLNRRKYEEGLLSIIDLQLSANTYFTSRVTLLQKQMLYILKDKLVEYYKGNKSWM
ncbi:MAG: TolC family protein [Muribaculum sp.]|nr:TolC family protein [Muribaculum sp.]